MERKQARAKTQLLKLQPTMLPPQRDSMEDMKDDMSEVSLKIDGSSPLKFQCLHSILIQL